MAAHDHEGSNAAQALEVTVLATVTQAGEEFTGLGNLDRRFAGVTEDHRSTHIYPVGVAGRHYASCALGDKERGR